MENKEEKKEKKEEKTKSGLWLELGAVFLDKAEKLQRLHFQNEDKENDTLRVQSEVMLEQAIVCFTNALRQRYIEARSLAKTEKRRDSCTDPMLYADIYRIRIASLLKLHVYHLALADAEQLRDLGARIQPSDYGLLAFCYKKMKWWSRSKVVNSIFFMKTMDEQWAREAKSMEDLYDKATTEKNKFVGAHRNANISVAHRAHLAEFIQRLGYKIDLRPAMYKSWVGDPMTRSIDFSEEQLQFLTTTLERVHLDEMQDWISKPWHTLPSSPFQPVQPFLYVAESKVHGRGLFTRQHISRGTRFGQDQAFVFTSCTLGRCGYCGNKKFTHHGRVWCEKCKKAFYCSPQCLEAAKKEFHSGVCGVDFKTALEQISDDLLSDSPLRNLMIFQLVGMTRNSTNWPCSTRDLPVLADLDDTPSLLITDEERKQGKTHQLNMRPEFNLFQKMMLHIGIAGHPYFDFAWYDQLCRILHKYTSAPFEKCLILMAGHLRFLNHGCEPNVRTCIMEGKPGQKPTMELVALRDIKADEELLHCYYPITLSALKARNKKHKKDIARKDSKPPKGVDIETKMDSAHVEGLRALGCPCTC